MKNRFQDPYNRSFAQAKPLVTHLVCARSAPNVFAGEANVGPGNERNIMKNKFRVVGLKTSIILVLLLLSACGGDDGSPGSIVDECVGEDLYGPEGGVIEVTDADSEFYGLRIVVPAGALDHCRSLYVDEAFVSFPPRGCIGFPDQDAQFALSTGGDKPYGLELEFYFPVTGMVIEPGESPCAFGYDNRAKKWKVILPDGFDGTTMTVKTTYHDTWMCGKIDLDVVSSEDLIGAMEEQYGEEMWNSVIDGVVEAIDVLETLYVDRTCPTWTRMRDVDLPDLIQTQKDILLSYQSQIDTCGTCNLFSLEFGLDLSAYILARVTILASDLWDVFFGDWAGYMPFLSHVDFFMSMERFIAISYIESQECDYSCVTEELGLDVYSTYALHHVYMVTQYMVDLAIDNDFWVSCP